MKTYILLFLNFIPLFLCSQTYIVVDPFVIRGSLGVAKPVIESKTDSLKREGYAVNIGIQSRFLSHILKMNEGWVMTDGIYADLLIGAMTSEKLKVFNSEESSRFIAGLNFGYFSMIGYAGNHFGVLAGPKFNYQKMMIGETSFPNEGLQRATCAQLRLEWRLGHSNEFRIQLTGWSNFSTSNTQNGFRLDIPIEKDAPSFLYFEYTVAQAMAEYPHSFAPYNSRLSILNLGWRFGSIY